MIQLSKIVLKNLKKNQKNNKCGRGQLSPFLMERGKHMDFTVSEAAKVKLDSMLQERGLTDVFYVMDYVDGDSPFYEGMVGCHCQVYDKYHLVVLKKDQKENLPPKYDQVFETNIGEMVFASHYAMMFDQQNVIDYSLDKYGFYLKSEAGILSMQLNIDFVG